MKLLLRLSVTAHQSGVKASASTHGALPPDVRLNGRHLPLHLPLLATAQAGLCINEIACDQQRSWLEPQQHSPCKCPARDTTQGSTTSNLQLSLQIVSSSSKHRSMTRVSKQSCNGFEQYSGKPDRVKPLFYRPYQLFSVLLRKELCNSNSKR